MELGASWLLLAPVRCLCVLGGGIQTAFQLAIIVSGNLSFLNHLTILPFIWCFDDRRACPEVYCVVFRRPLSS